MAIWKEIRKALNSTLGTSNFKPLNKLITDEIINQLQIVASDDVYLPLSKLEITSQNGTSQTVNHPTTLKATKNGSIRINGTLESGYVINTTTLKIYKNGALIFSTKNTEGDNTTVDFSTDILISVGDTINFVAKFSASGDFIATQTININICGKVQQTVFDFI